MLVSVMGSYGIEQDELEKFGYGRFRYEYRVLESLVQLRGNDTQILQLYRQQQQLINELTNQVQGN